MQHENYEKNLNNFKDIDSYIDSTLNFDVFLSKLEASSKEKTTDSQKETIDDPNYDNSSQEQLKKSNNKANFEKKLIDRLIFESKSLGKSMSYIAEERFYVVKFRFF